MWKDSVWGVLPLFLASRRIGTVNELHIRVNTARTSQPLHAVIDDGRRCRLAKQPSLFYTGTYHTGRFIAGACASCQSVR